MSSVSVFAEPVAKQVTAYLRPDLPITLDGKKVELEKAPIIYDGSTYLPLKELGGLFGKEANWNAANQSVELGVTNGANSISEPTSFEILRHKTVIKKDGGYYNTSMFLSLHFRLGNDGNYYLLATTDIADLLAVLYDKYTIAKSDNPYFKGVISGDMDEVKSIIKYETKYSGMNNGYDLITLYNLDKTKKYELSTNKTRSKGRGFR